MRKLVSIFAFLIVAATLTAVTEADHGERGAFRAKLTGAQEVPPVDTDTRGKFEIWFNRAGTAGEYTLTVNDGSRLTQAHFHCASVGVNGPVIVFLAGLHANGWDVDGKWISNATITDANITNAACGATLADLIDSMQAGNVYVNVHSVANAGGEIRGQIKTASDDD